jgi:hypothetical protein
VDAAFGEAAELSNAVGDRCGCSGLKALRTIACKTDEEFDGDQAGR